MCYDTMLIFLEYDVVAMGRRRMHLDVAVVLVHVVPRVRKYSL
jgi:hypothetical protein